MLSSIGLKIKNTFSLGLKREWPELNPQTHTYWIFGLMIVCAVVRCINLAVPSLWLDEAFTVFHGHMRIELLLQKCAEDTNPPLHYLLLKWWMALFGDSEAAVRLPSVLFNVFSIPLFWSLCKRFFKPETGLFICAIFIFSDAQHFFGQEARPYAMFGFLTLWSWHSFFVLFEEKKKAGAIGMAFANWMLFHTHYLSFMVFILQFGCALIYWRGNKKEFKSYFISQVIFTLACIPWMILFKINHIARPTWINPPGYDIMEYVGMRFSNYKYWTFYTFISIVAASPLLLFFKKVSWRKFLVLFTWGPITFLFAFYFSRQIITIFDVQYVLFTSLAFYLLIALKLSYLPITVMGRCIVGGVLIFAFSQYMEMVPNRHQSWREAVNYIKIEESPERCIFVSNWFEDKPFTYYYDREIFRGFRHLNENMNKIHVHSITDGPTLKYFNIKNRNPLILAECQARNPDPELMPSTWMKKRFKLKKEHVFDDVSVFIFENWRIDSLELNLRTDSAAAPLH